MPFNRDSRNVIVVDDVKSYRERAAQKVAESGFNPLEACSVVEFLDVFNSEDIGYLILDNNFYQFGNIEMSDAELRNSNSGIGQNKGMGLIQRAMQGRTPSFDMNRTALYTSSTLKEISEHYLFTDFIEEGGLYIPKLHGLEKISELLSR